ncbi:hypothetical protein ASF72_06010 [Arthrobacter sp. Leaf141]|uniref:hypothetical protein n=1 Tax=Micrococcaceae TaxID=1268 RepID=UPI0007015A5B|nr:MULTISPECIES: hypothetical protein [Micrococcaceae]KQR02763.1 hypothetical protein ASF72_06010 [Arthrobacter sp. Leaf141]
MFKKIASAAVLAAALAFSAAAPAVLSAGSVVDNSATSVAIGNWPDPASKKTKTTTEPTTTTEPSGTTYTASRIGNWPDPA